MGYSLSWEEAKKREKYVVKVCAVNERFNKFEVEYITGDRSEIYRPMVIFRECVGKKNCVVYLYLRLPITKATKVISTMEDNIISRDELKKHAMIHGMNRISEMPEEQK
jgi:hypothetical protein